jgi:hypothetical protein
MVPHVETVMHDSVKCIVCGHCQCCWSRRNVTLDPRQCCHGLLHFQKQAVAQSTRPMRQNLKCGVSLQGLFPQAMHLEQKRGFCFRCDRRPLHGHGQACRQNASALPSRAQCELHALAEFDKKQASCVENRTQTLEQALFSRSSRPPKSEAFFFARILRLFFSFLFHWNAPSLQHFATLCNILQQFATFCNNCLINILQHFATWVVAPGC